MHPWLCHLLVLSPPCASVSLSALWFSHSASKSCDAELCAGRFSFSGVFSFALSWRDPVLPRPVVFWHWLVWHRVLHWARHHLVTPARNWGWLPLSLPATHPSPEWDISDVPVCHGSSCVHPELAAEMASSSTVQSTTALAASWERNPSAAGLFPLLFASQIPPYPFLCARRALELSAFQPHKKDSSLPDPPSLANTWTYSCLYFPRVC